MKIKKNKKILLDSMNEKLEPIKEVSKESISGGFTLNETEYYNINEETNICNINPPQCDSTNTAAGCNPNTK